MKKLRFYLLLLICLISTISRAQVAINLFPSIANQFSIDDLWKTIIINPTQHSITGYISFQIKTGANTNVLTLTTQTLNLQPGANHLTPSEGTSAKWLYGNGEEAATLQSTEKLPFGGYTFCVTVYSTANSSLGVNCDERNITPMLPPQIAVPSENATVSVKYPVLSWIPPRPSANGITYSLRLTKLQNGQTPVQALFQNPPLLNETNLTSAFLSYPVNAPALTPGTYVWQVEANSGSVNIGTTDIGSFNVKAPESSQENIIYPVASKSSKEKFYVSRGIFRFAYDNTCNENILSYTIISMKNHEKLKGLPEFALRPGVNRLQVDLKQSGALKNGDYYYLEIKDKRGQTYKVMYYYLES